MKYYQNDPKFNGVYSRDKLPKIKDRACVRSLDEYYDVGTHWVALWVNHNDVTYFDSFGVEHIPKEIKTFINNKNIKTNTVPPNKKVRKNYKFATVVLTSVKDLSTFTKQSFKWKLQK